MDLDVKKDKDKIGEIALKANKEQELEATFKKIENEWKKAEIETREHKNTYKILGGNEDIQNLLEESMVTL